METYKLTITFSDGEVVVEKFMTELGVERAMRWWKNAEADDWENGFPYTIVSMVPEEIEPATV